jgi:hypothetical protein
LQQRRDLMIPRISAQHCPPRKSIGRQSRVCQARYQLLRFASGSLDNSFCRSFTYSGRYKPTTGRLCILSSNEELTIALHFSACAGAYYVTRTFDPSEMLQ